MATIHSRARRALVVALLTLALLVAPPAGAESERRETSLLSRYAVTPGLVTVVVILVVVLVQAARSPSTDAPRLQQATGAVDRALAASRPQAPRAANLTRWRVAAHRPPASQPAAPTGRALRVGFE